MAYLKSVIREAEGKSSLRLHGVVIVCPALRAAMRRMGIPRRLV